MKLSKPAISQIKNAEIPAENCFVMPERVLQFGTGVLLRGLPDYFIDRANKHGIFNGRVVVVKSTAGDTHDFDEQDCLYTHRICGLEEGEQVSRNIINASISRVLSAQSQWKEILQCASDPDMQIIISNTTEVGIVLVEDDIHLSPPSSFPGKLLAFLHERYRVFRAAEDKGMIIIPTELITENGKKLQQILNQLASQNHLDEVFISWLNECNHFCSSLVDRIVPGKLSPQEKESLGQQTGVQDELAIISEPYCIWAIETDSDKVTEALSFSEAGPGVVLAPDITMYRELKLRLLNGIHTFSCGPAFLSGFVTVTEAMEDLEFPQNMQALMQQEIIPAITNEVLTSSLAEEFAAKVLDRFRNPFIEHKWLSITLQYSSKMAMRNLPVILRYLEKNGSVPPMMADHFAAYILFMRCSMGDDGKYHGDLKGKPYPVNDDQAPFFSRVWDDPSTAEMVATILANSEIWGQDLNLLPDLAEKITLSLDQLKKRYENIS